MPRTRFGEWLESQIRERDWTLRQAATAVGVEQSSVSRYINGVAAPSRANLRKLAEFFEVSRDQLEAMIDADRGPDLLASATRRSQTTYAYERGSAKELPADPLAALSDPAFRLHFYELSAEWPDLSDIEQEDILATIAHRLDTLRKRREGADERGQDGGGP